MQRQFVVLGALVCPVYRTTFVVRELCTLHPLFLFDRDGEAPQYKSLNNYVCPGVLYIAPPPASRTSHNNRSGSVSMYGLLSVNLADIE